MGSDITRYKVKAAWQCYVLFGTALFISQVIFGQTYITHTQIVDVEKQTVHNNYTVEIKDGRLSRIGPSASFRLPDKANKIDGDGKWLIPGLIDVHIHLFQSGGIYTRPDAIDLRRDKSLEEEVQWTRQHMEEQLGRYLARGITTVIDDGATFNLLQHKQGLANKPELPRVMMAGPLLSTGYMPLAFGNLDSMDAPFIEVNSVAEITNALHKQYPYKPDFIKIWYIIRSKNPEEDARRFYPLLEAAIKEAHSQNLKAAVHVPELSAAKMALKAGADHLVHSIDDELIDEELIRLLQKNKVVVCPTLSVHSGYLNTQLQQYKPGKDDLLYGDPYQIGTLLDYNYYGDTVLSNKYRSKAAVRMSLVKRKDSISRANLKILLTAGIPIATGTDAGNIGTLHAASYTSELQEMQAAGMSNWQILAACTINGALALGKEDEWGSIKKGKSADMVLLNSNPLTHLDNLKDIHLVISKGILVRPDTLIRSTPEQLAQQQLNAYNAYNLDEFLEQYSDDVKVYNFPSQLILEGKAAMRKQYEFLNNSPGLHARVVQRIVTGNTVIDHEIASFPGRNAIEVIAMYIIKDGKIAEVYFKR